MKYKFKKWEDDSANPKRTVNILKDMTLIAYYEVVGMVEHAWEKPLAITEAKITGEITITGVPEVKQEQSIGVTINNGRTISSSGSVKVEVIKDTTVVDTLQAPLSITISAGGSWSQHYTWTPTAAGDYLVRVTYTEV